MIPTDLQLPMSPSPDGARMHADADMLRTLANSAPTKRRPHTRAVVVIGTFAVIAAGAGAAAAAGILSPTRATVRNEVRCYASVSTARGSDFPGTTVALAPKAGDVGTPDTAAVAKASCTTLWERGFLTAGGVTRSFGPLASDGEPDVHLTAPPLVACVLEGGVTAVYPGETSVCNSLGLPLAVGADS